MEHILKELQTLGITLDINSLFVYRLNSAERFAVTIIERKLNDGKSLLLCNGG